jgi:hypothetical protein
MSSGGRWGPEVLTLLFGKLCLLDMPSSADPGWVGVGKDVLLHRGASEAQRGVRTWGSCAGQVPARLACP